MTLPKTFLEALSESPLVADGAMGTMLYAKGAYINRCYDEMNLSEPNVIREIHADYLKAGAELLETNTFGANPLKLGKHGLAERTEEINRRGAEITKDVASDRAFVGGSVGPLGRPLSPIGKISVEEAIELYRPQIRGLVAGGVDVVLLETMSDLHEISAAVQATRMECDLPIVAMATFAAEGRTYLGYTPEEIMAACVRLGIPVVGANCSEGPHDMLTTLEHLRAANPDVLIAAMPNAGHPRIYDDRVLYMTSPEYMAEYARRFIQAGVSLVGGCCGTTPEHVRSIRSMVKAQRPARAITVVVDPLERAKTVEPVPVEERSPLGAKLARRSTMGHRFVVSVEMSPPKGHDVRRLLADADKLRFHGVDVVNVPDGPRASARMGAMQAAVLIQQTGMETILHFTCRDSNLLGMQAQLLGAHALGLRNVLAITGDPPKLGDYPHVTAVYDVESIGLVRILDSLNRGVDLAASPIGEPTRYLIGVGANPGAPDLEREVRRFHIKVEAGANFCLTQPVYDPELLRRFLDRITDCRLPVLVGILPLASHKNAEFLHNEVPGMQIPEPIRERMRRAGSGDQAREEGIAIAQEALLACKALVQGVYIMPPFGRIDSALKVLEVLL